MENQNSQRNMKILTTILLLAAMPAFADTITTISGTTYSDAKVTKTTPTAISITHSTGTAKIPFKDLPAAMQEIYGYDPALATEYEAQEAKRFAEQKQRAETQRLQAEQENAVKQQARLAKEQSAQGQDRQQAATQAEVDAKKQLIQQTTPLIMIKSDPKPRVPFWIKAEMQIATYYGAYSYQDARETHFAFTLRTDRAENNEMATGFMRRSKGEAVRQAIASKGGRMKAIIKGVYLPEMLDPDQPGEFEILEVVEQ